MFYYQSPQYKELTLSEMKSELDKITDPEMINLKELFNFIIERVISCENLYSFFIDTGFDDVDYFNKYLWIEVVENRLSFLKDLDFFHPLTEDVENLKVTLNNPSPVYYIKLVYNTKMPCCSSVKIMLYSPYTVTCFDCGKLNYNYCRKNVVEIFNNLVPYATNSKTTKRYPINLKTLFNTFSSSPIDMCDVLLEYYSQKSFVFRDVLLDYRNGIRIIPPITIDEMRAAHNKRELIEKHLKCCTFKRDNTLPLSVSYYIHKIEKHIEKNYLQELYRSDGCVSFCKSRNVLSEINRVETIFKYYFKDRFNNEIKDCPDCLHNIEDYISMCLTMKHKIKININSLKAFQKEHDKVSDEFFVKNVKNIPTFKIPKTRLSKLKLPSEYVLIRNKKLLIQEAIRMHNCVASYASKIEKGKCLIYTTLYEDKRYTIEIRTMFWHM